MKDIIYTSNLGKTLLDALTSGVCIDVTSSDFQENLDILKKMKDALKELSVGASKDQMHEIDYVSQYVDSRIDYFKFKRSEWKHPENLDENVHTFAVYNNGKVEPVKCKASAIDGSCVVLAYTDNANPETPGILNTWSLNGFRGNINQSKIEYLVNQINKKLCKNYSVVYKDGYFTFFRDGDKVHTFYNAADVWQFLYPLLQYEERDGN